MADKTTNGEIFKLINDLRLEVKGDIGKLSDKVDALDTRATVSSTKLGSLSGLVAIVASAITTVIVEKITGRTL